MMLCMIMLSLIIELTLILFNDVLKKLKPHKDDGNYGFKSDHLINGSNKLFIMLSIMFNAFLTHGFNSEDLLLSTIISIPKDNRGSMNSSDNYRGISVSNSICKLYDYVFIDLNMDYLKTDDMQFGFKNNPSTVLCTVVYIKTINHYMNEGSDVYSCLIDASKAFDKVHWGKLFTILIEKKVSYIFLRLKSLFRAASVWWMCAQYFVIASCG